MVDAKFLLPTDWPEIGRRHEFEFSWPVEAVLPQLLLFQKVAFVQWLQAGSAVDAIPAAAATVLVVREPSGLCRARPTTDLPVGEHIVGLLQPGETPFAAVSGVRIVEGQQVSGFLPRLLAARRVMARARTGLPQGVDGAPFFSITTTVYDTEPAFLDALFRCLREQDYGDFEWLLLDNGCKRPDTMQRLRGFAVADARVRLFRVENNIHIIPGNSYLLERARGRYVVPVDSDDLVYPDALAVFAEHLGGDSPPELLFSEECKVLQDGQASEYIWRSSFSWLMALATCPAAHLMAFSRSMAQQVGAYSDDYAQGSHDWDTCMRLVAAGARALRVPHILYGWRMHAGSSAMSERTKDYLGDSQMGVLQHAVQRGGFADRFEVLPIELGILGYYHVQRKPLAPRPLAVDFVLRDGSRGALANLDHDLAHTVYPDLAVRILVPVEHCTNALRADVQRRAGRVGLREVEVAVFESGELGAVVAAMPAGVFAKVIVDCGLRLARRDWLWDVLGTFELDPHVGVIGGRILDAKGAIQHVGYFAGLEGFVATPNHGEPPPAVYGTLAYLRRGTTAVYGGLMAVRADAFTKAGPLLDVDSSDAMFGIEFCLRAAKYGILTAYTPRLDAVRADGLPRQPGSGTLLRTLLLATYPHLKAPDPFHSALCGTSSATFGVRWRDESTHTDTVAPLINKVVRVAACLAWRVRESARQVVRRALRLVRDRPTVARFGFQVPHPAARAEAVQKGIGPAAPATLWLAPTGLLAPADPLHLVVDPLRAVPTLNVLLPGIAMGSMSGGPNTIFNISYRMAAAGVPVRFFSTGLPLDADMAPVWAHVQALAGVPRRLPNVEFTDASDRQRPIAIGRDDVFLATAWWTAQMVKCALPLVRPQRFLYVIQDFEAVLHEHSTQHALALETYDLDYVPFVNHRFLAEYLARAKIGRFADPAFTAQCTVIDPALDRARFFPQLAQRRAPRRLLFYARPQSAKRNLFELGIGALQWAVHQGAFQAESWEFLAMGDPIAPIELGQGHVLRPAPWRDFDGYAAQMRDADVLLSLMLSPHPSYPPLEMAACGGIVVTNCYANKTQTEFAAISPNILAPAATIEGVGGALVQAAARVGDLAMRTAGAQLPSPTSWAEALGPVLPRAIAAFHACRGTP